MVRGRGFLKKIKSNSLPSVWLRRQMAAEALLRNDYSPFLTFGSWTEIKHVIEPYKRFYGGRQKKERREH